MKILVRSRYREVTATTNRFFINGKAYLQFRQFSPPHAKADWGEAYMSPEEAKYLVESEQNRMHVNAGQQPEYSYPAGYPMPVADGLGGPLQPPLTEKNFHISDSRQLAQADSWMREYQASVDLAKAQAAAEARGDDPDDVVLPTVSGDDAVETAGARRARVKAEREAARVGA